MLVQLDRNETNRTFTPNSTAVPLPDLNTQRHSPVVAVLGYPGRVAGLAAHLPAGWTLRHPAGLDDIRAGEIVLISGATVHDVSTARALLPARSRIVTLVDDDAPAELVAGVLTAGADVCVRGGLPAILASHLVACRRRQLADRWNDVQDALPR
ncbi:hypothetical protein [Actinoplanes friuliensis]|jgi:hypothetical protein|uniref:Uncharacterized protein n=1 Tax=Actinoplanes friuliensis DSM 7358 TaxID=1246995 RepID=U5W026_9ACTN|nr:hypothetical protein [Actinoplanes friuliensis]AGZ42382.1 hypothetical protein AFR_20550 [Actinoplanes friuliensis DSM 7358]